MRYSNLIRLSLYLALTLGIATGCDPVGMKSDGDDSNMRFFAVYVGPIQAWNSTPDQKSSLGVKVSYRANEDEDLKYSWSDSFAQQVTSAENFRLEKLNSDGTVEKLIPFSRADSDLDYFDGKKLATDLYLDDLTALDDGTYRFSVNQIELSGEKIAAQTITFTWPLTVSAASDGGLSGAYEAFRDQSLH